MKELNHPNVPADGREEDAAPDPLAAMIQTRLLNVKRAAWRVQWNVLRLRLEWAETRRQAAESSLRLDGGPADDRH